MKSQEQQVGHSIRDYFMIETLKYIQNAPRCFKILEASADFRFAELGNHQFTEIFYCLSIPIYLLEGDT